jgi:transaldolase / glucose-6-phosphate isomerase
VEPADLVERIWARDPSVWTGRDEARWLGWLDEPQRMLERVQELLDFGDAVLGDGLDTFVLLGMGGSSLAPEVLRRSFGARTFHVLDTTHPTAIARLRDELPLDRTLFLVSSKSGGTIETRSHADFFWEATGGAGRQFAAITDPGSALEELARERGFRGLFAGEPTIGGRYSALSPFGLVPAALMGVDVTRLLLRVEEMREACRLGEGNPGLDLGLALGEGWEQGRDKVCVNPSPGGFGLWVEQLIAESTGKDGKGLVPAPDEDPAAGPDRQPGDVRLEDPYEVGQEFFRWEFATAVAGAVLGINPFDQPDVQSAKDRTGEILAGGGAGAEPESSVDELLGRAEPGKDYIAVQAFVDPAREAELEPLVARARATGCVVTVGLGPRYLHSTGQLHKGGPDTVLALQVVDDLGEELPIPGREFGFRTLISAQAAGDYEALKERGRRVARVRLEEVAG